ncbi:MAG: TatD family hydrolase [Acidimicrobiia bacterium]|nr:TatD family hydrolase [Acidimicrobiia bacterium]
MTQPRWIDTHGHLFLLEDDAGAVIDRAVTAGVDWIVCPGIDVPTSQHARTIAEAHPHRVSWTAGLHPHEAGQWGEVADAIESLAVESAGVGECGLDWYRELAPRSDQVEAFRAQLDLAAELDKPIVIHCRDAFADVHELVEAAGLGYRAIMHCWTGGPRWTKRFDDLGVTFSFAGPLTYPTADTLRRAAAVAPPDRTMVETDAPYLTPESRRPGANEPAFVTETGAALADVWGLGVDEVAARTSAHARRVFAIPDG